MVLQVITPTVIVLLTRVIQTIQYTKIIFT